MQISSVPLGTRRIKSISFEGNDCNIEFDSDPIRSESEKELVSNFLSRSNQVGVVDNDHSSQDIVKSSLENIMKASYEMEYLHQVTNLFFKKDNELKQHVAPEYTKFYREINVEEQISHKKNCLFEINEMIWKGIDSTRAVISRRTCVTRQIIELKKYWDVQILQSGINVICNYKRKIEEFNNAGDILFLVPLSVEKNLLTLGSAWSTSSLKTLQFSLCHLEHGLLWWLNAWKIDELNRQHRKSTLGINLDDQEERKAVCEIDQFCRLRQHEAFCRMLFNNFRSQASRYSQRHIIYPVQYQECNSNTIDLPEPIEAWLGSNMSSVEVVSLENGRIGLSITENLVLYLSLVDNQTRETITLSPFDPANQAVWSSPLLEKNPRYRSLATAMKDSLQRIYLLSSFKLVEALERSTKVDLDSSTKMPKQDYWKILKAPLLHVVPDIGDQDYTLREDSRKEYFSLESSSTSMLSIALFGLRQDLLVSLISSHFSLAESRIENKNDNLIDDNMNVNTNIGPVFNKELLIKSSMVRLPNCSQQDFELSLYAAAMMMDIESTSSKEKRCFTLVSPAKISLEVLFCLRSLTKQDYVLIYVVNGRINVYYYPSSSANRQTDKRSPRCLQHRFSSIHSMMEYIEHVFQ